MSFTVIRVNVLFESLCVRVFLCECFCLVFFVVAVIVVVLGYHPEEKRGKEERGLQDDNFLYHLPTMNYFIFF